MREGRVDALVILLAARAARRLLRVGDAASRPRFLASQWVDRAVFLLRGCRARPQAGRAVVDWISHLASLGFQVSDRPMSQGSEVVT